MGVSIGKSPINSVFSVAMFDSQRIGRFVSWFSFEFYWLQDQRGLWTCFQSRNISDKLAIQQDITIFCPLTVFSPLKYAIDRWDFHRNKDFGNASLFCGQNVGHFPIKGLRSSPKKLESIDSINWWIPFMWDDQPVWPMPSRNLPYVTQTRNFLPQILSQLHFKKKDHWIMVST